MRSVRPIPRAALPDNMTVRVPLADSTFEEPVLICYVRFERTDSVSDDEHRSADAGAGTVFVDVVNSIGAFDVPAGSWVAVGGRSLFVRSVHRCEDLFGRVHHWEIKVG
ncbi:MAG: minor capsid protein [Atopobiaceae bacterium]|nr:minor capsid protein [Atopobiaceae bacterium]